MTINGTVDFTITVSVPAGTAIYEALVGDTLSTGLVVLLLGISLVGILPTAVLR
jgi:hypothetical protein